MAASVRILDAPYWIGWGAQAWGLSWGYDALGNAVEVEEHGGGGGAPDDAKRKRETRKRNTQEKDLMEMLTIIMAAGVLNG